MSSLEKTPELSDPKAKTPALFIKENYSIKEVADQLDILVAQILHRCP